MDRNGLEGRGQEGCRERGERRRAWGEQDGNQRESVRESKEQKRREAARESKGQKQREAARESKEQKQREAARERRGQKHRTHVREPWSQKAEKYYRKRVYIGVLGIMILLHITAWNSRRFCDWYRTYIFRIWVDTYGRVTGMVPFSVGEILIELGAALAAAGVLLGLARLADGAVRRHKEGRRNWGQGKLKHFCKAYCKICAWLLLGIFVLMTLNCYILYHGSDFTQLYLEDSKEEYTLEDLEALRNFVVSQCNALCCQMRRDTEGTISCPGDMAETARAAMRELGKTYSCLSGFYPAPKPLYSSDFLSQQYIAGCFFPFSMEANYNTVMYVMNMPSTMCHELAHLKGFIREDEANLIGYLACVGSEDICFRYSGYLSVLYYIDNDFREAAGEARYGEQPGILPQVHGDNLFLTSGERDRIEKTALWDTRVVDAVSDSIADASLRLNGVEDGMVSYSRVVELLLRYYDVWGYPENSVRL